MKKLLVATNNLEKLKEVKNLLGDLELELVSIGDLSGLPTDVEETGTTFEENACIKATVYGDASGMETIADDSGLEVDALDGRPGVYSARYAATTIERNEKLLREMRGVKDDGRTARFVSAVCLYDSKTKSCRVARGVVEGKIDYSPKGNNGFGYDPVFYSTELNKTFGEATDEEKNEISHRARAIHKLKEIIIKTS